MAMHAGNEAVKLRLKHPEEDLAVVVEGAALDMLGIGMDDESIQRVGERRHAELLEMQKDFIRSLGEVTAVLCCRVSPKQKGDITNLVKTVLNKVTLGVGDGANDVAMIKNAHVGVGIQGVEGSQAVNNSDFALTEFCNLADILLVHGRWTYKRIASATCYFFYKSIAFNMTLVWYSITSGFGGNMLYDAWLTTLWSPGFTAFPVVVYALMEQDLDKKWSLKYPRLYTEGPKNVYLNTATFLLWILNAMWDSIVVYLGTWLTQGILDNGKVSMFFLDGVGMYANILIVTTGRLWIQTQYFNWITFVIYVGSVLIYYLYLMVECAVPTGIFMEGYYWVIYDLYGTSYFWLGQLLIPVVALLPPFTYKCCQICFNPTVSQRVQRKWKDEQLRTQHRHSEVARKQEERTEEESQALRKVWSGLMHHEDSMECSNVNRILSGEKSLTKGTGKTALNVARVVSRLGKRSLHSSGGRTGTGRKEVADKSRQTS